MKRLLTLLILIVLFAETQAQFFTAQSKSHVNPPTETPAPTDYGANPATTINTSMGSSISQAELGTGVKRALVPNPYEQRLQALQLVGAAGDMYYWKSASDIVRSWVGGSVITASIAIQGATGTPESDFHRFEHLGLVGNPDTGITGITGASWNASATGTTIYFSDVVAKDTHFAGFRINNSDNTKKYKLVDLRFVRSFGYDLEGEGFYLGSTSTTNYSLIENCNLVHAFVYNKGRDGFQFNSIQNLYASNLTAYQVGVQNTSAQRSLLQAQNVNGTIENFVMWGAPKAGVIGSHGLTIKNGVMKFNETGDIQDLVLDAGYTGSLMETGTPIRIENVYFYSTTATVAWSVSARGNNVEFVNCKLGGTLTSLYTDARGASPTNTITETGTTTEVPPAPVITNFNPDDDKYHGIIWNTWYTDRGWGFKN